MLLRRVMARELDTISEYEGYAAAAHDERLQAFFQHLADEEKEHVAEALKLIEERDSAQKKQLQTVDVRPDHFAGAPKQDAPPAPPPAPAPAQAGPAPADPPPRLSSFSTMTGYRQLTVGSLKTRR